MRGEPSESGPGIRPGTERSPIRILSVLSQTGNHRVLADWIHRQERSEIISGDDAGEQIRRRLLDSSQRLVGLRKAVSEFVARLETAGDSDLPAVDLEPVPTDELTKCRETTGDAEVVVAGEIPQRRGCACDLLGSVFRNLLSDAGRQNDSDTPRVAVAVQERTEAVAITIADNGSGIPPEKREAVVGRTEEGLDHPAAGLGLSLVDTLLTKHRGTIQSSDADPGGACIEVELQNASSTEENTTTDDS